MNRTPAVHGHTLTQYVLVDDLEGLTRRGQLLRGVEELDETRIVRNRSWHFPRSIAVVGVFDLSCAANESRRRSRRTAVPDHVGDLRQVARQQLLRLVAGGAEAHGEVAVPLRELRSTLSRRHRRGVRWEDAAHRCERHDLRRRVVGRGRAVRTAPASAGTAGPGCGLACRSSSAPRDPRRSRRRRSGRRCRGGLAWRSGCSDGSRTGSD